MGCGAVARPSTVPTFRSNLRGPVDNGVAETRAEPQWSLRCASLDDRTQRLHGSMDTQQLRAQASSGCGPTTCGIPGAQPRFVELGLRAQWVHVRAGDVRALPPGHRHGAQRVVAYEPLTLLIRTPLVRLPEPGALSLFRLNASLLQCLRWYWSTHARMDACAAC